MIRNSLFPNSWDSVSCFYHLKSHMTLKGTITSPVWLKLDCVCVRACVQACVHVCVYVQVDVCVRMCGSANAVLAVLHSRDLYTELNL